MFRVSVWLRDFDCEPLDEALEILVEHWCSIKAHRIVRRRFPNALDIEMRRV